MEGKCCKNRGDYVFESLKKDILNLTLKPGQPISENEICTRFDVSRTPVREAYNPLFGYLRDTAESGGYPSDDLYARGSGADGYEGFYEGGYASAVRGGSSSDTAAGAFDSAARL